MMEYNNSNKGKETRQVFEGMSDFDLNRQLENAKNKIKEQQEIVDTVEEILKERM